MGRSRGQDPYTTLPAKTTSYIQLRFQLSNFANVYRIVQLPVTFTFANLHTLIQYMFGWSNSHMHCAEVVSYVVMQDPDGEHPGTMKRWGRMPTFQEYLAGEEEGPRDRISWKFERDDNPIYRVDKRGVRSSLDMSKDYAKTVKDSDLTLGDVWKDSENNASCGDCPNDEMGIIYQYDLSDPWTVHISCDANELFFETATPLNMPLVIQAKGAPPIEHVLDEWVPGEDDADDKTVANRLFVGDNFELYCENKLMSCARKTELAIYTPKEEKKRQARLQRERDERQQRMEVDDGEEGEEDYDDDDSGEYY